jgi:hypothetical protein
MRHLSLSLIVGALLLAACDMKKNKVEPTTNTQEPQQREEVIPTAPVAAPALVPAPVKPAPVPKKTTELEIEYPEEDLTGGALVEEDILIQAEEEPMNPRMDEHRTYNEKQISDDELDYPIERSSGGETYNETQISR